MGLISFACNGLGLLLLTHSIYSAHEHTSLLTPSSSSTTADPTNSTSKLPTDITIELLLSVLLVCIGVVLASPSLRPIEWSRWGGEIEKEGVREEGNGELRGVNPYALLEERRGFWDVRAQRKEFADWVRGGAGKA